MYLRDSGAKERAYGVTFEGRVELDENWKDKATDMTSTLLDEFYLDDRAMILEKIPPQLEADF